MNARVHALPHIGANAKTLSIAELSQLLAMEHGSQERVIDLNTLSLFGDSIKQPVTLEEVIDVMLAEGYTVSAPYRHYPAQKKWHAEWHMDIKTAHGQVTVCFLIPLEAS